MDRSIRRRIQTISGWLVVFATTPVCQAIDVTAVTSASDASNLASQVMAAGSSMTLGAANFNIDTNVGGPTPSNFSRQTGDTQPTAPRRRSRK